MVRLLWLLNSESVAAALASGACWELEPAAKQDR